MIVYTTQDILGRFSSRWGCYSTVLINIIETEKHRTLSWMELMAALGVLFYREHVLMSNYKNHKKIGKDDPGWSADADPELHFYVLDQNGAINDLTDLFMIPNFKHDYVIQKLKTQYGSHFILKVDGVYTVNPDPSISGVVVENRKVS